MSEQSTPVVEVKPSYKSLEGQSIIVVVLSAIVAGFYILTGGDTSTVNPETAKLILESGLSEASSISAIIEAGKEAEGTEGISKVLQMLAVFLPSSGLLGYFTKKRSDVKIAAIPSK